MCVLAALKMEKPTQREKANDYMRRSLGTSERVRVPTMSETMQEMMEREKAEAIRTLNLANKALERLFGITEQEVCDECGEIHEDDFNE